MSLKDKVIFVSGGSRGIGLAIAKRAAQDGAKLALAANWGLGHHKLKLGLHLTYRAVLG